MNKYTISGLFLLLLSLSSCFKEDDKIPPHDPGDVLTQVVDMTEIVGTAIHLYTYQKYFDLYSGQVVSTNYKKDWDLGFECSNDGHHILLNTASFMLAAGSGSVDFEAPIDTTGFNWRFDQSDGNLDSTAIGNWFTFSDEDSSKIYTNEVYVIDRGYDEMGNVRGLRKIVFLEAGDDRYVFKYANMDGSNLVMDTVIKDPAVSYVTYSFANGGQATNFEPPKYTWDLLFTQYTTIIYTDLGEPYPYLVTGVFSNRVDVEVARDTIMDFFAIDLEMAEGLEFSRQQDKIGYDWKDIVGDPSSGSVTYVVIPGINYIIKDQEGYYYKLRFIEFYSDDGLKGYPKFEYQRL